MGKENVGQPSGTNKSSGTGVPSTDGFVEDMQRDQELTREYTEGDDVADSVRTNNPNRNTDKGDATNAGGYKN